MKEVKLIENGSNMQCTSIYHKKLIS